MHSNWRMYKIQSIYVHFSPNAKIMHIDWKMCITPSSMRSGEFAQWPVAMHINCSTCSTIAIYVGVQFQGFHVHRIIVYTQTLGATPHLAKWGGGGETPVLPQLMHWAGLTPRPAKWRGLKPFMLQVTPRRPNLHNFKKLALNHMWLKLQIWCNCTPVRRKGSLRFIPGRFLRISWYFCFVIPKN